MDEPEVDYMSDDFLNHCSNQDIRPGLIKNHGQKRTHDMLKKKYVSDGENKRRNISHSALEAASLQEGLQKPISTENKGFSMMEKMGFKVGSGLGKSSSGIVEPVGIQLKHDRTGFGRAAALEQIKLKKVSMRKKRLEKTTNIEEFRSMQSKKNKERQTLADLSKSQRLCHQLDVRAGIEEPAEKWFWPKYALPKKEEEQEEEEVDDSEEEIEEEYDSGEKVELLTEYLRRTFFYCIWCGVQFENAEDLEGCPGATYDDH